MLKSMTSYGRAQVSAPFGRVLVEVHAVNRKHLDISLNIPKELSPFDPELRKWVAERVQRGRVSLSIKMIYEQGSPLHVRVNAPLAKEIGDAWKSIASAMGSRAELTSTALFAIEGVLESTTELEEEELYRDLLRKALTEALDHFEQMQLREGEELAVDMRNRLDHVAELVQEIRGKAEGAVSRYRAKLLERVNEVITGAGEDDRILREVALFAEKVDIQEELTRLDSHYKQFISSLGRKEPVGKRLDFLLQEMFRESNTLSAKVSDVELSHLAVEMKAELERVREQVQNVE